MRHAFAHDATLQMDADADIRAPGAAITVALCGHWEHPPPCPLAPHHTDARRAAGAVHLRTLFAAESDREDAIRQRIDGALREGRLVGPDGVETRWQLRSSEPSAVTPGEADHAQRLIGAKRPAT